MARLARVVAQGYPHHVTQRGNRTQQVQAPDPTTGQPSANFATSYAYDAVDAAGTGSSGPLVISTVSDPNGRVTSRYSDAEGKVWKVVDAKGNATRYDYFAGGLLKTITDANGNVTAYAYDGFDRLASVTDPYGKATTYTYYADGKLQTRTDAKSQTITYAYDNLGRLLTKSYGTGGQVAFAYTGDRVATVTDGYHPAVNGSAQSYAYTYDTRHRLASVASPTGTVTYSYVSYTDDQIATVSDGTAVWAYAYYPGGSLAVITAPEGDYTYSYNEVGQVNGVNYPPGGVMGAYASYTYDWQHRVTAITNQYRVSPSGVTLRLSLYGYGEDGGMGPDGKPMKGMISEATEVFEGPGSTVFGPYTTAYGYDANYQLTQAVYPAYDPSLSVPWANQAHSWAYDAIGNRLTFQKLDNKSQSILDLATYAYNLNNKGPQLAGITHANTEPAVSFTYDGNGNTLAEVAIGATKTYTWDMDDKLVGLSTSDNSVTANYIYAYNGDRLQRTLAAGTNPAATWKYLYSKEDILKIDQGGVSPMYLTQGPGIDDVLAETTGSQTLFAMKNMLSSVTQLTAGGSVASNTIYDAWGQANTSLAPGASLGPYGYTGREWDAPGLWYYRNRYMRPDIGRFLSVDLGDLVDDGPNYSYVNNMPIFLSDPYGLQAMPPGSGGAGSGSKQCCTKGWGYKGGVPRSNQDIGIVMDCIQQCYGCDPLQVTSTTDSHDPGDIHTSGLAFDLHYPNNPKKALCCAALCGIPLAIDEKVHPSPGSNKEHLHLQLTSASGKKIPWNDLPHPRPTACQ